MNRSITQKDIAWKLGVSAALVSRVLSGKGDTIGASRETAKSIMETASKMGYVPNANARSLKGAPTRTLGVVVYDFEDPFLGTITGALHHLAHQHDYTLVLVGFEQRRPDALALRPLVKHGMDGLILVGSSSEDDGMEVFRSRNIPVARIGMAPPSPFARVTVDNADGIGQLLAHLARCGCPSAGFIGDSHPAHQERLRNFREACRNQAIHTQPEWQIIREEPPISAGYNGVLDLLGLNRSSLPRALVAASDTLAVGALRALQEKNVAVPGRMALTGFDGIPITGMLSPSLTTLHQPVEAMATTAFEWVLDAQSNPPSGDQAPLILLKGTLLERESTGQGKGYP